MVNLHSLASRLILALLALLLGLVPQVHATPPLIAPAVEVQAPDLQPAPVVRVYFIAYRSQGPPGAILVVRATSSRSAWCIQYAYCGGDPVNRSDPSGLYWEFYVGESSHMVGGMQQGVKRQTQHRWVPWIDGINEPAGGPPQDVIDAATAQLDLSEGRGVARIYTGEEEAGYLAYRNAGPNQGRWIFRHDQLGNVGVVAANEAVATAVGIGDDVTTAMVYYGTLGGTLYDPNVSGAVRSVAEAYDEELDAAIPGLSGNTRLTAGVAAGVAIPIPGANGATRLVGKVVVKTVDYASDVVADLRAGATVAENALPRLGGSPARSGHIYLGGRAPAPAPVPAAIVQSGDVVTYRPTIPGFENHHGVLDVWASHNVPGYVSRAPKSTSMALTKVQHDATREVYRQWLKARTGREVGGSVDWATVTPREVKNLADSMFDAAGISGAARNDYYSAFSQYLYGLVP